MRLSLLFVLVCLALGSVSKSRAPIPPTKALPFHPSYLLAFEDPPLLVFVPQSDVNIAARQEVVDVLQKQLTASLERLTQLEANMVSLETRVLTLARPLPPLPAPMAEPLPSPQETPPTT
jgi:hypothetical protein